MKNIFLLTLMLSLLSLNAQKECQTFSVYFDTDKHNLDDDDSTVLKSIVNFISNSYSYTVDVVGHTDNRASLDYNKKLSQRRSLAVYFGLVNLGILEQNINYDFMGEIKPIKSNDNDENMSKNRRVTIQVCKHKFINYQEILNELQEKNIQTFQLKDADFQTIVGEKGTEIIINNNTFITKDGKILNNKDVTIELQEFQTPMDFLTNSLVTKCEDSIIESAGMFNIEAKYKGETVNVANGKSMQANLPSKFKKENMELFYGEKNVEGDVVWKKTSKPFTPKKPTFEIKKKGIKVKKELLSSRLIKIEKDKFEHKYVFNIYKKPSKPSKPKAYRKLKHLKSSDINSSFLTSRSKKKNLLKIENDKIDAKNSKNKMKYEKALDKYYKDSISYLTKIKNYENNMSNFYDSVINQVELFKQEIVYLEQSTFNKKLNKLINLVKNDSLYVNNPYGYLITMNDENETANKILELRIMLQRLDALVKMDHEKWQYDVADIKSSKFRSYVKKTTRKPFIQEKDNTEAFQLLSKDREFTRIINPENLSKNNFSFAQSGIRTSADEMVYSVSFDNVGYINCDRFTTQQLVSISMRNYQNTKFYFYVKEMNSVISYSSYSSNTTVSLPKDKPIVMLALKSDGANIEFDVREFKLTGNQDLNSELKKGGINDIKKSLNSMM